MAVSADELNGYRRDRYFARSWALLTMEKGWWKPVLIMALFGLIPIVGILALAGYALETARVTAWGINAGPKQKDLKFGTYIATGFTAAVIALALGLAYGIATTILSFIPVVNLILIPIFIVVAFVYPLLINVIQVRAAVYGRISAGFSFKNIFKSSNVFEKYSPNLNFLSNRSFCKFSKFIILSFFFILIKILISYFRTFH